MLETTSTITIQSGDGEIVVPCAPSDTVLRAALRAGVAFPYECGVGGCGSCRAEWLEGETHTLWESAPGLSAREKSRRRVLACQTRPLSNCRLKVRVGSNPYSAPRPRRRLLTLLERRMLTSDMAELIFQGEGPAEFEPGQYALFDLPGVDGSRAYSMSNTPNREGHWHFIVRITPQGAGSAALGRGLGSGEQAWIDAPFGLAHFQPSSARDLLCIAGGSGLAPVLSIARAAATRPIAFYFGGRTPSDLCARPMLQSHPGFGESLRYREAISSPQPNEEWRGEVGFIHELVEKDLGERVSDFEIYMAGPPPMLQAALELLVGKYSVPIQQIHYDRFF
jgi:toluene monooxygenase electron transfer component